MRADAKPEPLVLRQRGEPLADVGDERAQRHGRERRLHPTRVEPGDIEQGAKQLLRVADRLIDPFDVGVSDFPPERRGEEPRGVKRLDQIVAGRGEKAGLVARRAREFAVEPHQLGGALGHANLQSGAYLLQRGACARFGGDVGEAHDVAASRHRSTGRAHNAAVAAHPLEIMHRAATQMLQSTSHMRLDLARPAFAPFRVEANHLFDWRTDGHHALGIGEQVEVAAVPRDEALVGVDHADPGFDVFQRGGEQPFREAQALPALVEHPCDVLVAQPCSANCGADQRPGGRHPDHASDRAFRTLQIAAGQRAVCAAGEQRQRLALADEARDKVDQARKVGHLHG